MRDSQIIPVARPRLPPAGNIYPYLQEIDNNARYGNFGPLHERLQARLAEFWGIASSEITLVANATAALTLALQARNVAPGKRCLMPSWTFAATAGAVVAAGLIPHFLDVCPGTWCPNPADVRELSRRSDVGAILIVAPFGAPIDLAEWDRLSDETGLPLVVDAAAAFDTIRRGGPMPVGNSPMAVSLHATKVFGVGEGGALIVRDPALVRRVRALSQFGFFGTREAQMPAGNAKLSEYAAAVGLAGLDLWPETRARWDRVTQSYLEHVPSALTLTPHFGQGWVASTFTALWPDPRPDITERLAELGIATLSWWGPGCREHAAYRHFPAEDLPVTRLYAPRAVGLPFYQDVADDEVEGICTALKCLLASKPARTGALRDTLMDA